jgi:hypothetical protein
LVVRSDSKVSGSAAGEAGVRRRRRSQAQ